MLDKVFKCSPGVIWNVSIDGLLVDLINKIHRPLSWWSTRHKTEGEVDFVQVVWVDSFIDSKEECELSVKLLILG